MGPTSQNINRDIMTPLLIRDIQKGIEKAEGDLLVVGQGKVIKI